MDVVTAIVTGVVVLLAFNLPWAVFAGMNFRVGLTLPWAVVPMALYIAAAWQVARGTWGGGDGVRRRALLRANRLSTRLWIASLGAGLLGFASLLMLLAAAARIVHLPVSTAITSPAGMAPLTMAVLLTMQSIVAAVSEEAAFRGYMQTMIERAHGPVLAVIVSGLVFGLLHFGNHPRDVVLMLPYYVAVSAVYGGLTWACDSILPALVLHAVGDTVVLIRWWTTGLAEWQVTATVPSLISETGVDRPFVGVAAAALILCGTTAFGVSAVRRMWNAERHALEVGMATGTPRSTEIIL
ncbi:MAG: type II CAAX endopeptidase family protein [Vicinamibacterales bacterium]